MSFMLPTRDSGELSLAEVLPSCLSAMGVSNYPNALELPHAQSVVVVVVDGLGIGNLKNARAHARFLASHSEICEPISTVFPSTTAVALTSLSTAVLPGTHGIVGYKTLVPEMGEVVNQLTGLNQIQQQPWLLAPPVFSVLAQEVTTVVIGHPRFSQSALTEAIYAGAQYLSANTLEDRVDKALETSQVPRCLTILYISELDEIAHKNGVHSTQWVDALETLDAELKRLTANVDGETGILITADHGIVDVPSNCHVLMGLEGELDCIRAIGGEPRCLQLYVDPQTDPDAALEKLREKHQAHVSFFAKKEIVDHGLYGDVAPEVLLRLGDIFALAHDGWALYDARDTALTGRNMIGQHGGTSDAEMMIPALRLGAFSA